jgi:flagellar motor switch protein FliN/FliY
MTDENKVDVSAENEVLQDQGQASEVSDAAAEASDSSPDVTPSETGELADSPDAPANAESPAGPDADLDEEPGSDEQSVVEGEQAGEDSDDAMLRMLEGLPDEPDKASPEDINFGGAAASKAEFQHLQQSVAAQNAQNIELLMDVDLPVSIELGRTKMNIANILSLGPGSVVELNKLAGEPVDLLVNYKVVAKGEVVVVDENFGLRITQLMTQEERLRALAEE